MAPITIYIHYNGEIIYDGNHIVQYEGTQMKIIIVFAFIFLTRFFLLKKKGRVLKIK